MQVIGKWILSCLLAILSIESTVAQVALESTSPQQSAKSDLRVMSFNIRYGAAADGENHWKHRRESVVETIQKYQPDVLGTQEELDFQTEFLQSQLPEFAYFGRSRELREKEGEKCGIFYRRDHFTKVKAGQFWLSEQPDEPGSKAWDAALPRIATWILLKDQRFEDRTFLVLNTHFDHIGKVARIESAKQISQWLKLHHPETAMIVMGDFNAGEKSLPYNTLVGEKSQFPLIDSFRAHIPVASDEEGTGHGFRGTRTGGRIDWILHNSHFKTSAASIVSTKVQDRYPSDHFPVTANLIWGDASNVADDR